MKQTIEISQLELQEFVREKLQQCGIQVIAEGNWLVWKSNGGHIDNLTATVEAELQLVPVSKAPPEPIGREVAEPPRVVPNESVPLDTAMFPNPEAAALLNEQIARMSRNENDDGTLYPGETPHRMQEAHTIADLVKGWPRGPGR